MSAFARFSEHPEAGRLLDAALREGPAHAYLFYGPPGVGKREVARAFARELLRTSRDGAAKHIAALSPRPTAIFAANDSMAVGVIAALVEEGLTVPRDMTVVGFDDIPIAHYISPPLTTIGVDIAELGRRAFGLLCESIAEPRRDARQECIGTKLIVRKSCGTPNISEQTSAQPVRTRQGRKKGEDS